MKLGESMARLLLPLLFVTFLAGLLGWRVPPASTAATEQSLTFDVQSSNTDALCRFGVNAVGNLNQLDLASLRVGWYINYQAQVNPLRPNDIEYMPVISLRNYPNISLSDSQILAAVAANPGSEWFIGNEPDRPGFNLQDNLPPAKYAEAYHRYYHLIKGADPAARIIAGNIVQPTPVRLLYLDAVLTHYYQQFGQAMPVDIWGFHNFILREVSCDADPGACWGAETPTGMGIPFGEVLAIDDNDRFDLFTERIYRFRQWLADRGYRGVPIYLSEYGILMPADYGFPPSRVNTFMNQTFDLILAAKDTNLGDPRDGYRLVQRLSWYSDVDLEFNGNLFNPATGQRTSMGDNYANFTAVLQNEVDFYPTRLIGTPATLSQGGAVNVNLQAQVANSGNLAHVRNATVQFYQGNPSGGTPIGSPQPISLRGCGRTQTVSVTWPNVSPGLYNIYVQVTAGPGVNETDLTNNLLTGQVFVGTEHIFLPSIHRAPMLP
jgi:hypothetical protein